MTIDERLSADYGGTGINIGRHPMFYHRAKMTELGVTPAAALAGIRSGKLVRIAGCVVVRQRPGTAKGIVFLSIEDETGIANSVVMPDIFEQNRLLILSERWLLVECRWLRPESVGQFEYLEWTADGHLRHSRFISLHPDKRPIGVIQE
jgi:error-prone DNA polymerase